MRHRDHGCDDRRRRRRDALRTPRRDSLILWRGHLYGTAAITGATLHLLLAEDGLPRPLPTVLSMTSIVPLRFTSIL